MNLYLISQTVNQHYDTFEAAVVVAANEHDAARIHPARSMSWGHNISWDDEREEWTSSSAVARGDYWADVSDVQVRLIGQADASLEPGAVVCASFRAG